MNFRSFPFCTMLALQNSGLYPAIRFLHLRVQNKGKRSVSSTTLCKRGRDDDLATSSGSASNNKTLKGGAVSLPEVCDSPKAAAGAKLLLMLVWQNYVENTTFQCFTTLHQSTTTPQPQKAQQPQKSKIELYVGNRTSGGRFKS